MTVRRVVTLDFETYYDSDYTLKKLTVPEYIRDPRFSIIGVAASINGGEPKWFSSADPLAYRVFLEQFRLEDAETITVAHNVLFDGAILEWILGIHPHRYFCTMMGARPFLVPHTGSMALRAIAYALKLGIKGDEVVNARGKYHANFSPGDLLRYAAYCCQDVVLSFGVFCHLLRLFPADETVLLDLTVKKFTRPQLKLNAQKLEAALSAVREEKAALLTKAGLTSPEELMSNPKFAALLLTQGIKAPVKISPTTGKYTHAFAQTDRPFIALLTHPNPRVQALVEARLAHKSTLMETRLDKLLRISRLTPEATLPAALLYYGAHPGRFSGYDGTNLQNLPRGSVLRESIEAPPGYKLVAGDLSQIECRITAVLAGQWDLVQRFAYYDAIEDSDRDVYCEFGDAIWSREVTKADKDERFICKTAMLSLGFQVGAPKFHDAMLTAGIKMEYAEALAIVETYRLKYMHIPRLWDTLTNLIQCMAAGIERQYGPVKTGKECLHLPNGMVLSYPGLSMRGGSYVYTFGKEVRYLYGGKLAENIAQALARIIMTTAELRLFKAGRLRAALSVHDELIYVVLEKHAKAVASALTAALRAPVKWMPQLPVNCEVGVGDNYHGCK